MPKSQFLNRQHAIGGAVGVAVIAFALAYRFYPVALQVTPAILGHHASTSAQAPTARTTQPKPGPESSQHNVGPPISLAPAAVVAARALTAVVGDQTGKGDTGKLLAKAGKAARKGNLAGTGKDSAVALVLAAAHEAPDNSHVRSAISRLHARLLANAQQALAAGDAQTARADLAALRALPGAQHGLAALSARIDVAPKVQPLLQQAAQKLQQGKLVGPGGDTALALYRQVLGLDPENVVARQGLKLVQHKALDHALSAAAQNDQQKANAALADAAAILPSSNALAATRARIAAMRSAHAHSLMTQADSALDAGDLALAQQLAGKASQLGAATNAFNTKLRDAREYANYYPGEVFTDPFLDIAGHGPAMVVIPRGSFLMGASPHTGDRSSAERPQHKVTFAKGFAMARSEVTVAQFRAFIRTSGYVTDADKHGGSSVYNERNGRMQTRAGVDWQDNYAGKPAKGDDPVVNVSWNDAHAYAAWLSKHTGKHYHLPSEAEYEYAERAGTTTRYWWGNGTPKSKVENLTGGGDRSPAHRSWSHAFKGYSDGYWGPAPIMQFQPNPFGLYDMDGNVSEWVADCWHDNYHRAPRDGSAWLNPGCTEHVIRGGSWGSAPAQDRSSYRLGARADLRSGRVGFRVARDL
jgi:formylglycine-generating enzyme required for sulfatase activity